MTHGKSVHKLPTCTFFYTQLYGRINCAAFLQKTQTAQFLFTFIFPVLLCYPRTSPTSLASWKCREFAVSTRLHPFFQILIRYFFIACINLYWSLQQSMFHYQDYSSYNGWEGILINVTFVSNNLVILSKPSKMRIGQCLRFIIKSRGEQTLQPGIDHVWRREWAVNTVRPRSSRFCWASVRADVSTLSLMSLRFKSYCLASSPHWLT